MQHKQKSLNAKLSYSSLIIQVTILHSEISKLRLNLNPVLASFWAILRGFLDKLLVWSVNPTTTIYTTMNRH